MQTLTTYLWFDNQAEEAVNFYTSLFKDSKVEHIARYGGAGAEVSGQAEGSVMTISFQLFGQDFIALNGGPVFTFSPAISFLISCETQEEVDELWEKLSADGGKPSQCGWITDKFGITWQIVPSILGDLLSDSEKSEKVMQVMLKMSKLDIQALQQAYDQ